MNKIINIPYVVIFTSKRFHKILVQENPDEEYILSYETINHINDSFYNTGGVVSCYDELMKKIESFKLGKKHKANKREL